jgi:hypothetical protein
VHSWFNNLQNCCHVKKQLPSTCFSLNAKAHCELPAGPLLLVLLRLLLLLMLQKEAALLPLLLLLL